MKLFQSKSNYTKSVLKSYALIPRATCQHVVSIRFLMAMGRALLREWEAREGTRGWKQDVWCLLIVI